MLVKVANADGTLPFYEVVFDELRDSGYVLPKSIFDRCTLTIYMYSNLRAEQRMYASARWMYGSVAVEHVRRSNACSVVFVLLLSASVAACMLAADSL